MASRQCVFFHVLQAEIAEQTTFHNDCIGMASCQCVPSHASQEQIFEQIS